MGGTPPPPRSQKKPCSVDHQPRIKKPGLILCSALFPVADHLVLLIAHHRHIREYRLVWWSVEDCLGEGGREGGKIICAMCRGWRNVTRPPPWPLVWEVGWTPLSTISCIDQEAKLNVVINWHNLKKTAICSHMSSEAHPKCVPYLFWSQPLSHPNWLKCTTSKALPTPPPLPSLAEAEPGCGPVGVRHHTAHRDGHRSPSSSTCPTPIFFLAAQPSVLPSGGFDFT